MGQLIKVCFQCGGRRDETDDIYSGVCWACTGEKVFVNVWNSMSDEERKFWSENKEEIINWMNEENE